MANLKGRANLIYRIKSCKILCTQIDLALTMHMISKSPLIIAVDP